VRLQGKIAAITGGTAGIGRAIAEIYLQEGAKVALMGRNAGKGETALSEMKAGDRGIYVAGDVTSQSDVERFIDTTVDYFETVDILVNNAGGAGDLKPTVDLAPNVFDHVIKLNLYSTFWATKRALATMIATKSGRIINISSVEGKHGKPVVTPYTAAKHAINGLTKSVAREVGTLGITVNAICPGLVLTDLLRDNGPSVAAGMGITFDELVDMYAQDSALKRPNTPEEIAALALLLASEEGGGITGAILSVDGGTAQY